MKNYVDKAQGNPVKLMTGREKNMNKNPVL